MEGLDLKNLSEETATTGLLGTFGASALVHKTQSNMRPEKRLQAQILSDMMAIDRERAFTTMKAWATFVQLASRTRSTPFETMEEYIPARVIDAGEL